MRALMCEHSSERDRGRAQQGPDSRLQVLSLVIGLVTSEGQYEGRGSSMRMVSLASHAIDSNIPLTKYMRIRRHLQKGRNEERSAYDGRRRYVRTLGTRLGPCSQTHRYR